MRASTKFVLACSFCLVLLSVVALRARPRRPAASPVAVTAATPRPPSSGPASWARIDGNLNDPRYQAWLQELRDTSLAEEDLFRVMRADLSPAQKKAAFQKLLRQRRAAGSLTSDPARWSRELRELIAEGQIDVDLAGPASGVLRYVSSAEDRAGLEARYREDRKALVEGGRDAIVRTSSSPEFLRGVLGDQTETATVRESALGRLAALGERGDLVQALRKDPEALGSTLATAAVGALGEYATDAAELREAAELARALPAEDQGGHRPVDVVRVGIASSKVHGKAQVLFEAWRDTLAPLERPDRAPSALVETLVAGHALARALWTEEEPRDAAQVLEEGLRPLVTRLLQAPASETAAPRTQAVAELVADLNQHCVTEGQGTTACADPSDPRALFARQLAALLRPRLGGTDLEFLLAKL